MRWLKDNMNQTGFMKFSFVTVAMLLTVTILAGSYTSQSSIAHAQQLDDQLQQCIPSQHRITVDGQQVATSASLIQEFVDQTPVAVNESSERLDETVINEGFASIPLSAELSTGNFLPDLRSAGFVFQSSRFSPDYTVWRVRNRSNSARTVTVRSQARRFFFFRFPSTFSRTVEIPAYSDGFIRSSETSFFRQHEVVFKRRVVDRSRNRFVLYNDDRTIGTGDQRPLFELVQETGLVNVPNDDLPSGITLAAAGIFAGEPQVSVWRISNGDNQAIDVTLDALDSDDQRVFTVPANTDTYVTSNEDGCIDNVEPIDPNQEALWVAESEGLVKVLTESGDVAFELEISETIEVIDVSPIDRTVWVVTQSGRLEGFNSLGQQIADIQTEISTPITSLEVGTNNAWLVSEGQLYIVNREDEAGLVTLTQLELSSPAIGLTYDSLRDRVWVQQDTTIIAIDELGETQDIIDIQPNTIRLAAYDKRLDQIWIVTTENGADIIARYSSKGEEVVQYNTNSENEWLTISPDSQGGLWLANTIDFSHIANNAVPDFTQPAFSDINDQTIIDIAAGSNDQSVWIANQTILRQYSVDGSLLQSVTPDLGDGIIRNLSRVDLETELPDTIPSIEIVSPENEAVLTLLDETTLHINPKETDLATIVVLDNDVELVTECAPQDDQVVCTFNALTNGEHSLSITASADDGTQSEPALVSVSIDNTLPVITINTPLQNSEVSIGNVTVSGTVSELVTLTINGNEVALNENNQFSATVAIAEDDTSISVVALDQAGNETINVIEIVVNNNQSPSFTSTPITTAQVQSAYQYDVDATDPDSDELIYSLNQAPDGLSIDTSTGLITWTPTTEGSFQVVVLVNDNQGASVEQSFVIQVEAEEVNEAPTITSTPVTQAVIDSLYTYTVVASDPEGAAISYRLLDAPNGLVINAITGQITWTPFDQTFGNVTVQATDSGGLTVEQSYSITVSINEDQQPPLLLPIADIIAPLGQTTNRTFQASDPEGESILYGISPLPLPDGMNFEISTGEFEYRPVSADAGTRSFTITATDGRFVASQAVQITVPEPSGETTFSGQILFPDGSALPGVRIEIEGQEATSDENGDFSVRNIPGEGRLMFFIDSSGVDPTLGTFASIPEQFNFVAGTDNQLFAPIFLEPIDLASADPVDPFRESVITSSDVIVDGVNYGPVTITIAPETGVDDDSGELFDRNIAISRIPDVNLGPTPMPDDLDLSVYISVQPFGVSYTEPAEVSFPNVENFPAGTIVEVFGLNHETGAFEFTGEAEVSADGRTVDSIGGVVFANSWHGFTPRPPAPGPDNDDCDCEDDGPANSSFGRKTGNFKDYYQTPSYYSVGEARTVKLNYNSKWANSRTILNFDTLAGLPPPVSMSQSLVIGGIETPETFLQPDAFGSVLSGAVQKNGIQVDTSEFVSGIYPYEFTISCQFPISRRSGSALGETVIINESKSPYGAGWTVDDLRRIHVSEDRTFVAMDLANGHFWRFTRNPDGTYESPSANFDELIENADGSFRLITKYGSQYDFDLDGLLTSMSDRNNNETFYTYDNQQRLTLITDPVGLQTRFTYIGDKLDRITDPSGRFVEFEHDSEGNLITIKDPDNTEINYSYQENTHLRTQKISKRGFISTVSYDQFGRYASVVLPDDSIRVGRNSDTQSLPDLSENTGEEADLAPAPPNTDDVESNYVDANGNLKSYQYNNNGFLMNTTDAVGRTTEIQRDADQNPMVTLRPNGSVLRRTYDDNGNILTSLEEFNGALTTYTYDQFSLLTSKVDALGRLTVMNRDERGNVIRAENAEGHVSTYDYNARGQVIRMVAPNSLVTEYEYNAEFLMVRKTETPPVGSIRVSTVEYNEVGLSLLTISPDGIEQTHEYDALNRLTSIENQLGELQEATYDEFGNVIENRFLNIDNSIATQEARVYDNRERLVEVSRPHEEGTFSRTTYEYDANSNMVRKTDPDDKVTQYFYDGENREIQTTYPDSGVSTYEYDTRDQLVSVRAPNNTTTTYEYDVLRRKTAENSPDRGRWSWDYNIVNKVTTQTDNRNIVMDYTYDRLDRPLTKTFPTESENVTYRYDDCTAGVGHLCERDDESGQYTYEYDFFGNILDMTRTELGVTYTENYVYDDGDNLLQCTYPTGRVIDFQRDGIRRVSAIASNGSSIINDFSYRGDSQMIGRSWENGIQENREYDQQARLLNITLGNISERDYRYDASSNIININSPFQNGIYDYDLNDRLVDESLNTFGQTNFEYELNGNRLREGNQTQLENEAYIYQENSNRLLSTEEISGNTIDSLEQNRVLIHNDADRIRRVSVNNQVTGVYIYNDTGLRSRKTIDNEDGNSETTIYHYNIYGALIAETSIDGVTQREYVWNGMESVAQIDSNGITYLHSDHLYTTRLGTNDAQQTVWQWESQVFGNTEPQVESVEVNLRFPGQYADDETGLYYNWNRYYDPSIGRYVTSDPIGLGGG